MPFYWDTSALLALLFEEREASRIRDWSLKKSGLPGYTTFFTLLEMESAYARRLSEGSIAPENLTSLRLQSQRLEDALGIVWPDQESLGEAKRLITEMGLRPGDALQLASAKILFQRIPSLSFVCLDEKLNQAAQASGLPLSW